MSPAQDRTSTGPSLAPAAETFAAYFPPNPYRHGLFTRLIKTRKGETKKAAETNDGQPVTLELIAQHLHLNGHTPNWRALGCLPVIIKDGTALTNVGMIDLDAKTYATLEPGYHNEHGYFLNTAGIEVELMDVSKARDLFLQTFNEFSYQAPKAGFTATLAFILQPFLMPVIDDLTPLYALLGAKRTGSGTGKGYLLDCVSHPQGQALLPRRGYARHFRRVRKSPLRCPLRRCIPHHL